jgi:hypothetical protein
MMGGSKQRESEQSLLTEVVIFNVLDGSRAFILDRLQ